MPGKFSVEKLVHFSCYACGQWWTIGDPPEEPEWYCPRCGTRQAFLPAPPLDTVSQKTTEAMASNDSVSKLANEPV